MISVWLESACVVLPSEVLGAAMRTQPYVTALFAQSWWTSPNVGRAAFAALFAVMVVWLLLIPARRIGQAGGAPPWWRNIRFWAIFVAAVQMMVYVVFG